MTRNPRKRRPTTKTRNEIPIESRWDLTAIFPTVEAWETAYRELEDDLPELDQYKGRLGDSADVLAAAMETQFALNRRLADIYVYANEWLHTEADNATAKDLAARAQNLSTQLSEATSFIDPELAQIPDDRLVEFLKRARCPGVCTHHRRCRSNQGAPPLLRSRRAPSGCEPPRCYPAKGLRRVGERGYSVAHGQRRRWQRRQGGSRSIPQTGDQPEP